MQNLFQNVWIPLAGGALIGLASLLLFALNGRIAGISGILGNIQWSRISEAGWRLAFLLGLICGGVGLYAGHFVVFPQAYDVSPATVAGAGLLVGFGTRLGSGCTSGHGVCGVSRFSKRSLLATVVFMVAGIITVALVH